MHRSTNLECGISNDAMQQCNNTFRKYISLLTVGGQEDNIRIILK